MRSKVRTEVVAITCRSRAHLEEQFTQQGLAKAARRCDRCGR